MRWRCHTPRANEAHPPVRRREALDAHHALRTRCVDELVAANGEADVGSPSRHRFEEHEVAWLNACTAHDVAGVILVECLARQSRRMLREDPLHEAAAIESSRRAAAAVAVGRTAQGQCGCNHLGQDGFPRRNGNVRR